ncbi:VirK/YbjX family protein [Tabrizicola sp.]|uniref:VirK/YbjX family protein n=1 Tax=Tabrizicola sp. TaxID=2005166 RepID=UPI003F37A658
MALSVLLPAARRIFPGNSPRALITQAKMVLAGMKEAPLVQQILQPPAGSALERVTRQRPHMIGALMWPYISASFDAGERLRRIISHYQVVDTLGPPFQFDCDERLVLVDLGDLLPGLRLVLDQPEWFLREGGLTLNLFIDSFRAFSIAFSLRREADGRLTAWIGGIQGRNRDDMLETYRMLTKLLHGLRPRDFLLDVLKMLLRQWDVGALYAVSDISRHHRHPYFGGAKTSSQNYDDIWTDRGGTLVNKDFFELPLSAERRDEASIKPNKRPMYRRRFEFMDELEARLLAELPKVRPTRFADS